MKKLYAKIKYLKLLYFSVAFVLSLRLSVTVSESFSRTVLITSGVLIAASVLLGIVFRKRAVGKAIIFIPLLSGILLGGLWGHRYVEKQIEPALALDGRTGTATAVITSVDYESEYLTSFTAKLITLNGQKQDIITAIEVPYAANAKVNDLIRLTVTLSLPADTDTGGFNEKEYYFSEGINILCIGGDDLEVIGEDRSVPAFFRRMSDSASAKLTVALGETNGGFISALILGRKDLLPDRMETSFRYLGISHVLSVSGLHLAVLMTAVIFIATALLRNRYLVFLASTVFGISFVILVGAPPSAIRAAVMILISILATVTGRESFGIYTISYAALVISLIDPSKLFTASYLLSMGASLGIIVLGGPACSTISKRILDRNRLIRTLGAMGMLVCVTLSAVLFTLPVVKYFFGEISLLSVPANLLFVPICTVLLYLSAILILLYGTPIAPIATLPVSYIASLTDRLTYSLSLKLPEPISLNYSFATVSIVLTAVAAVLLLILMRKRGLTCLLVAAAVFASSYALGYGIYSRSHSSDTNVLCSVRGTNEYILLNKDGKTLLIDISDGSASNLYQAALLSRYELYDSSIDTLLLTHLHRKHISAVIRLADRGRLSQIYVPKPQSKEESYFSTAIERAAVDRDIQLCYYDPTRDTTFDFKGCHITLFRQDRIERSTQPIHLIMLQDRKRLVYCGGSVNDSRYLSEKLKSIIHGETYLWLGIHGPLIKKPLDINGPFYSVAASSSEVNDGYQTDHPTFINGIKAFRLN